MNEQEFKNLKTRQAFTVPEGYFEKFPNRMVEQVHARDQQPRGLIQHLAPYLAVAAVFVLVFLAWNFLLPRVMVQNQPHSNTKAAQTTPVQPYYQDFNEQMLVTFLDEDEAAEQPLSAKEKKEIIDFLTESDVDNQIIIEAYMQSSAGEAP